MFKRDLRKLNPNYEKAERMDGVLYDDSIRYGRSLKTMEPIQALERLADKVRPTYRRGARGLMCHSWRYHFYAR